MAEALGLLETRSFAAMVEGADAMVKAATRKESTMDGLKFMMVKNVDAEGKETGGHVVAVDAVGVGPGELVLIAAGSSARQTIATQNRPCDAVIMAIVDSWEIGGVDKYRKD